MAESDRTLHLTVFDKRGRRKGWVSNPLSARVTERWLALGDGEVTVADTDPIVPHLLEEGAWLSAHVIDAAPAEFLPPEDFSWYGQIIAGPVTGLSGSLTPGTLTCRFVDNWTRIRDVLAWVVPAGNVKATALDDLAQARILQPETPGPPPPGTIEGLVGRMDWGGAPITAAQAIDILLAENLNRRYQADLGRDVYAGIAGPGGGELVNDILPQVRMGTLEEYAKRLLATSDLGMKIVTRGDTLFSYFWQPRTWSTVFTPDSGVVEAGDWNLEHPTATRALIGGPGEEAARAFRQYVDTDLAARFGRVIEVFRDATGAPMEWPDDLTDELRVAMYYHLRAEVSAERRADFERFLDDAAADVFEDGAPTSGVSVTLAESEGFRYRPTDNLDTRNGFRIGDRVTVSPSAASATAGLRFTDRLTEITITQSRDNGFSVTPQLGQKKDDPDAQLAQAIRALAESNRRRATNQ